MHLVLIQGTERGRVIPLRGAELILGRQRGCGLRIAAHEISRQHCRIRVRGQQVAVLDLGSANGTFVNGRLVRSEQLLGPGDHLQIGPVTFLLEDDASATPIKQVVPLKDVHLLELAEDEEAQPVILLEEDSVLEPPSAPAQGAKPVAPPLEPASAEEDLPLAEVLPGDEELPRAEVDEQPP